DSTTLAVSPSTPISAQYGDPLGITAALRDSAGQPIREKSITFVATSGAGTFAQSAITGLDGQATLGATPWPAGSDSLRAYLSGTIPAIGDVTDSLYLPSSANGPALTISGHSQTIAFGALANKTFGDPPFTVSATSSSGEPITFGASPIGVCRATGTN